MRFGIAVRLGLLLAGVGFVASGLTGFYAYHVSRDLLVQAARNELMTSTQVLSRRILAARLEIARNLEILATHPTAVAALETPSAHMEQDMAVLFTQILRANPNYFQIRLISAADHGMERVRIDREGETFVRVEGDDLQEKGHYPYVSDTLAMGPNAVYLSRIVINHERGSHAGLGQPTVLLAMPVVNSEGQKLGLIVVNVDLNGIFGMLKLDLPPDFELYLANTQGDYLIHPDKSKAFGFDRGRRVLIQDDFPSTKALIESTSDTVTLEGRSLLHPNMPVVANFIGSTTKIPNDENRLILGLAQPLEAVLDQGNKLGFAILQIVIGFFLGCALLATFLARAITRPINSMSAAAQSFANDQQTVSLPVDRQDEIGLLARSLKKMQEQIKRQLTELQASQAQLEHLAGHDVLTGLPNRRLFQDRLEHALARAQRTGEGFALLFIDVDKFKGINDRWGHEAGDAVLKLAAMRLASITRKADTVARVGGDEFVILLDNPTSRQQIVTIAEKLLDSLRSPMQIAGQELQVGFSVGISQYPEDGTSTTTLMARADQAMYEMKAAGRNGFRFSSPSTTGPGDY
jgi:diguanylate cyclase (GGDEF)-like protein